jgi:predicted glycoside hydrolase/deacetylase ChbG (UPF0249 family)
MKPNPVLKKLGYANNDRLVIIHTDDIGMCHASIQAFMELWKFGLISSGATMVPSSWFPHVARYCQQHPDVDMGVHLTLTSEWESYRWSAISTRERASGLYDAQGYFYRSSEEAQANATPEAVQVELQAQLERAICAGINVTHIDTHMSTVAHPKFVTAYVSLAIQNRIPFLLPRLDETGYRALGLDAETAHLAIGLVDQLEEQGIPLVDNASGLDLAKPQNRLEQAKQAIAELQPGITHFVIHPSINTEELQAITPDWQARVADYNTFKNEQFHEYIHNSGVQIIGYKQLKDLLC